VVTSPIKRQHWIKTGGRGLNLFTDCKNTNMYHFALFEKALLIFEKA
jgi:hypothetical protein